MTHTEESLMALHRAAARDYAARDIPTGELYRGIAEQNWQRSDAALRLAIRDVLAERDEARKSDGWQWVDSARADRAAAVSQWRAAKERAEKAEADRAFMEHAAKDAVRECERLRTMIRNLCMGHVDNCRCTYCKAVFRSDAATKEQP